MKILLVAATEGEVPPDVANAGGDVHVLVTGVGMVATAAWCARTLARARYDLALNVGVCGAFLRAGSEKQTGAGSKTQTRPTYLPGTVVHVVSDRLSELGAEDGEAFLTIHDLKLLGENDRPFSGGQLVNQMPPAIPALMELPVAAGITVSTVHGNADSIAAVAARYNPDVESMEGAAFMYACLIHDVPFAQVRAVSNLVERRNREAWKMAEAVAALHRVTRAILAQA